MVRIILLKSFTHAASLLAGKGPVINNGRGRWVRKGGRLQLFLHELGAASN